MSNEGLKSQVFQLERRLGEIQQQNAVIRGERDRAVSAMGHAHDELNNAIDETRHRLGGAGGVLHNAHQRIVQAGVVQAQMDQLYGRLKQMELANKHIRACNNKKYYEFAVYRNVRKIVQGIMDNLDFSFVNDETIEKAIEKNHLRQPDYWLTCVLLAVMAWRADQRERADRALQQALELDSRKTAAFLMIFYMRLHRETAALKWFTMLTGQPLKGSERSLVLLFFSMLTRTLEEEVSQATRRQVTEYINDMVTAGMGGAGREQAIARICAQFIAMADDATFPYPVLARYVTTHQRLAQALAGAQGTANVIDFVSDTLEVEEAERNEFLKYYIDEVVDEPCVAERAVYDEIAYNEMIIAKQGDVDAAKSAFAQRQREAALDLDVVGSMVDWVFLPSGKEEANPQMRRSMLVLSKPMLQDAAARYINRYRSMMSPQQQMEMDGYQAAVDLSNQASIEQGATDYQHGLAEQAKAKISNIGAIVMMVVGMVAGVLLGIFVSPFLAIAGVAVAGAGGIWFAINMHKRRLIDQQCERAIQAMNANISSMCEEWKRYASDFHEQDLLSEQLMNRLESI